jgi:hypothetical protein
MKHVVRIAIVDNDKDRNYPSNFICMLPQRVATATQDESVFARIFGKERVEVARTLLTSALEYEDDSETRIEIRQRLKRLENKSCTDCET